MTMSCAKGCCPSQADHYRSLRLNGAPSKQMAAQRKDDADMAAYKRLRGNGVQPRGIEGSAVLERQAESKVEIERGHLIKNDRLRKEVETFSPASVVPS